MYVNNRPLCENTPNLVTLQGTHHFPELGGTEFRTKKYFMHNKNLNAVKIVIVFLILDTAKIDQEIILCLILSYNASAVKKYYPASSLVRFENEKYFILL
jgi:SPX domain protein involved in polyphosphate accumulation